MADTPIPITRAEYEAKFGAIPTPTATPAPIPITRAEYEAKFGPIGGHPRTWGGAALDAGKQFASGAVEGTASLGGMLADVMGKITNPLSVKPTFNQQTGEVEQNFFSMPYTQQAVEAVQPYIAEPKDDAVSRYSRTVGEFVGPGGAMGALSKGGKLAKAMMMGTDAAAGIGAQAAEDITGDDTIAPMVGALSVASVPSIFNAGKRVWSGSAPEIIEQRAGKILTEQSGLSADDIGRAANSLPEGELSKFRTTAEVTDNPALAKLEKTLGDEQPGYYETAKARNQARENLLSSTTPAGIVNIEDLNTELVTKAKDTQKAFQTQAQNIWSKVDRNAPIDVSAGSQKVKSMLMNKSAGLQPKGDVKKIIEDYTSDSVRSFGDLQDIRSDSLYLMRSKDLPEREKAILSTIQDEIDSAAGSQLKGQDYQMWKEARATTRREKELFDQTTPGGSLVNTQGGIDTALQRAFKGGRTGIKQLKEVVGNNSETIDRIKSGVVNMIPRNAQEEITSYQMRKFLKGNESSLRELFGNKHYKDMLSIADDLKSQDRVQIARAFTSKGQSMTAQAAMNLEDVQKLIRANSFKTGIGVIDAVVGIIGKRGAGKDQRAIRDTLYSALMNPKYAAELAKKPQPSMIKRFADELTEKGGKAAILGYLSTVDPEQNLVSVENRNEKNQISDKGSPISLPQNQPVALAQEQDQPRSGLLNQALPQSLVRGTGRNQGISNTYQNSPTPIMGANSDPKQNISYTPEKVKEITKELPPVIRAIIKVESNFNPKAESKKGAQGAMQLMPAMQKALGVDDPFDPVQNINGGIKLLKEEADRYQNPLLAIAAYNLGSPRLNAAIKRAGSNEWSKVRNHVPQETRQYVTKVLAAMRAFT